MNSEKKIDNSFFSVRFGTTDKNDPKSVYVYGRAFIVPNNEKKTYDDDLSHIWFNFKKNLRSKLIGNKFYDDKFIANYEIASTRMKKGKKSSYLFEVYLKINDKIKCNFKTLKDESEHAITNFVYDLVYDFNNNDFDVYKKR